MDLDLLSLPLKYGQESSEGLRESKLKKVNNGGERLQEWLGIHWGKKAPLNSPNGQFFLVLFKGGFFPNGSPSFELIFAHHC